MGLCNKGSAQYRGVIKVYSYLVSGNTFVGVHKQTVNIQDVLIHISTAGSWTSAAVLLLNTTPSKH